MPPDAGIHAWSVGAFAGMTLAVMMRASLGHTGRTLIASRTMQGVEALLRDFVVSGGRYYAADKSFSDAAPGTAWDYCNLGYGVAGHVASRIAGEDLRDRIRRIIFAPLGLRRTSWTLAGTPVADRAIPYDIAEGVPVAVAPVGFADWPAGMIRSSAAELGRWPVGKANRCH
eukprot:gene46077-62408_t